MLIKAMALTTLLIGETEASKLRRSNAGNESPAIRTFLDTGNRASTSNDTKRERDDKQQKHPTNQQTEHDGRQSRDTSPDDPLHSYQSATTTPDTCRSRMTSHHAKLHHSFQFQDSDDRPGNRLGTEISMAPGCASLFLNHRSNHRPADSTNLRTRQDRWPWRG